MFDRMQAAAAARVTAESFGAVRRALWTRSPEAAKDVAQLASEALASLRKADAANMREQRLHRVGAQRISNAISTLNQMASDARAEPAPRDVDALRLTVEAAELTWRAAADAYGQFLVSGRTVPVAFMTSHGHTRPYLEAPEWLRSMLPDTPHAHATAIENAESFRIPLAGLYVFGDKNGTVPADDRPETVIGWSEARAELSIVLENLGFAPPPPSRHLTA